MAKTLVKKRAAAPAPTRTLMRMRLADPGMTPILRAGLGGLASTLRAFDQMPKTQKPSGTWTVTPAEVVLDWSGLETEEFFAGVFGAAFRLSPDGFIDLPGTYAKGERPPADALAEAQRAYKQTFLQHGKSTGKASKLRAVSFEIDGASRVVRAQPLRWYTHQNQHAGIAEAVRKGSRSIRLAGWAYPGAAQRHIAHPATIFEYAPEEALCACFALVGCLSFNLRRGGALIVPDPADLTAFGRLRPRLTPTAAVAAHAASLSDAALSLATIAAMEEQSGQRPGVRGWAGFLMRATAWDSKQKYRVSTWQHDAFGRPTLALYAVVRDAVPLRLGIAAKAQKAGDASAPFLKSNPLRAFITDNLANDRPWYAGFAVATDSGSDDAEPLYRIMSQEARKGLQAMLDHLDAAERRLVNSVHTAMRQRFGAIAEASSGQPAALHNRFQAERDKWRLALAGAKMQYQLRATLADLWSRAGSVKELQDGWEEILPLLRADRWQAARDLALIALASYASRETDAASDSTLERGNAL